VDLCKDCHAFVHSDDRILKEMQGNWSAIKWWVERFSEKDAAKFLRRIEHFISRIKLLDLRLKVLRKLNTVGNIKKYGYRTYWINERTHGDRTRSKYRRKKK